ncbi:MAG TPA: ABC transporter permease [Bryobacteraceae bacterium]
MRRLKGFLARLSGSLNRKRSEREMAAEIESHLELHIDDNVRAGMTPEQARREALLKLGGVEATKERYRDRKGLPWLAHLGQDVRYGARQLHRNPGFTIVAALSLALGIGANTAIFTLFDQVLLRLLPLKNPQELVQIQWRGERNAASIGGGTVSYPFYGDIRDRNQVFSGVMCRFSLDLSVAQQGHTDLVTGELVSGNYFEVLGVSAALGRVFTPEDNRIPDGHPRAVLSYDYWTERFGADPNILGQKILVNNFPMTVIGVSAKGFEGLGLGVRPAVRVPVAMAKELMGFFGNAWNLTNRRAAWLELFARLAPGIAREQAQASLAPLFQSILESEADEPDFAASVFPKSTEQQRAYTRQQFLKSGLDVVPAAKGTSWVRERYRTPLRVLMALVGVMLLMAAVNVANLLLARAAARQRETAVRLAIGASRSRLVRQSLTEAAMLALLGGAAGLLLAVGLDRVILALIPAGDSPLRLNTSPDARVLGFTLIVSVAASLIFGLLPALRSSRLEVSSAIKEQAGSAATSPRLRKTLMAAQVFLSTILLLAAGMFLRTLANLKTIDPGFRVAHMDTFSVSPDLNGYRKQRAIQYYRQVLERLRAVPGVESAALASIRIVNGDWWGGNVAIDGYTASPGENMNAAFNMVTTDYFQTLGIPLLEGRYFQSSDTQSGHGVVIVSESFARHYFGEKGALGRRLQIYESGPTARPEIVGVVRDVRYEKLRDAPPREVYLDFDQHDDPIAENVYVKTRSDPAGLFSALRAAVRSVDPNVPISDMLTLNDQVARNLATERLVARLTAAFGFAAAILVAAGLYGLMAFTVARRTREIGIRVALGARRRAVIWLVLREVVALVGTGALLALPVAWGLSRYVQSELYGVAPGDPTIAGGLLLALIAIAAIAAFIPARRAGTLDPTLALRCE